MKKRLQHSDVPFVTGRQIAIVGRPNVGKSAIFNRLMGQRLAIVHSLPGVTRDRLVREMEWEGVRFGLIDTGGLMHLEDEKIHDPMELGIGAQAEQAIDDADVAILVVDVVKGVTPQDMELARMLRRKGMATLVAANKADEMQHEMGAVDFESLGFPVFPVSALHGRGFMDLMDKAVELLPPAGEDDATERDEVPEDDEDRPLRVAIVGRPNAGKSSFINKLLGRVRVLVSDVPGTTRDSIDVPFATGEGDEERRFVLIDTAGARRDTKIDTAVERYSRFRTQDSIKRADIVVLMLDSTRGVGRLDKSLAGEILAERKGCLLMVNKWDLAEVEQEEYDDYLAREIPFMGYCPVVYVSAETGYNVRESLDALHHVAEQTRKILPTGQLNRVFERAAEAVAPPVRSGRALRLYYATQVSRNPQIVRLFVNDAKRVPANYRDYLINQMRLEFGLEGAPIILQLRARPRKGRKDGRKASPASSGPPKRSKGASRRRR